ncbi:MAG: heat shock protein HspQ [Candidatus Thiodiazotropha sp. (ex Codakia rugifera)]|nr:heat shock protein HspQ [Candidatus Thiodiazotropha sp. (ex Codakia rugifera)]
MTSRRAQNVKQYRTLHEYVKVGLCSLVESNVVSPEIQTSHANFSVGDLVYHRLFDYRGVVVDVDPQFMLSEEWYENVARSRPPKDQPWYRVLVHSSSNETYVAERNLTHDTNNEPVDHPLIKEFFREFSGGRYLTGQQIN